VGAYDCYTVVVDVCLLVQFFLKLGVLFDRLDTARVKSGLVDGIDSNHVSETGAVEVGGAGRQDLGFGADFVWVAVGRGSALNGVGSVI
jgi:hypothetical protein